MQAGADVPAFIFSTGLFSAPFRVYMLAKSTYRNG